MVFSNNLLFGAAAAASSGATPFDTTLIGNSLWVDGSADYLNKTPSAGTTTRWIWSSWVQRTEFGANDSSAHTIFSAGSSLSNLSWIRFDDADHFDFGVYQGATTARKTSSAKYRDIGWYHLCISFDSGSGVTASDRIKLFVNGIEVTELSANTDTPSGETTAFNGNVLHEIGRYTYNSSQYGHGYLAQFTMLENKSFQNGDLSITDLLDSFTFGTNGSQFTPKADADIASLASSAGGRSFCLDFANSSDLGNDISSNNNDFTPNSMAAANQSTSTPSLTFSTYNILDANAAYTSTDDGANTYVVTNVGGAGMRASLPITSGKWYWEQRNGGSNECGPAISAGAGFVNLATNAIIGEGSGSHSVYLRYDNIIRQNAANGSAIGITNGATAVMGVAFDADTGKVWFRDSSGFGTSGDPANGTGEHATLATTSAPFFIAARVGGAVAEPFLNAGGNPTFNGNETAGGNADANGRGNFKLGAVPTGFLSLNTANLSAPTYQGIDYFAPTLYEGNGTGQRVGNFVPFTDAFDVAKSAMFQHDEARALSRTIGTPSSTGGKKGTWSTWYKTANIDTDNIFFDNFTTATNRFTLNMDASGQIFFANGSAGAGFSTSADLKGGDVWRNVVLKVDTSQSTATDRARIYIDGVEVTSFATDTRSSLTQDSEIGYMDSGATQFVGSYNGSSANQWDGYLAETIFLDNQFLSADSFGQLDTSTNKWVPKDISGLTLGDQGFYLAYGGNFGTGNGAGDSTGNSNNLTEIGTWTSADQFTDTPSNNVFTFATDGTGTISEGNTRVDLNDSVYGLRPTIANFSSTGKFYGEFLVNAVSGSTVGIGFARDIASQDTTNPSTTPNNDSKNFLLQLSDGNKINGDSTGVSYGSGISAGQTVMWAFDAATRKIWFGSEGTFFASGNPAAGTNEAFILPNTGTVTLVAYDGSNARTANLTMRNATAAFEHTAPTGFTPFTQDNLDDTASKLTAWAWIKNRDATDSHVLVDRVRGVGEVLHSNELAAEATEPNTVQRFLQRGVQVGSDVQVNTANEEYVLWQWLVGDSATTGSTISAGSISTDPVNVPSIASTVIAADAGHFSVGTYTGQTAAGTVGHGLGGVAEMVIVWDKGFDNSIAVYHVGVASDAATDYLLLNGVGVPNDDATFWNDTTPTSSVFSVGTGNNTNGNTRPKSFLAFRSVAGVCKVGSYIGNGSATSPPYVSVGFKPSWVMIKNATVAKDWVIVDTARTPINTAEKFLFPNLDIAEAARGTSSGSDYDIDLLADGFRPLTGDSAPNGSGNTILYMAMADIGGNGTLPPIYGR
jgi:hypothetical protein